MEAERETLILGLVLRAMQFAAQKHKDERRKDVKATPYINHPINLAEVLHTDGGVPVSGLGR